MNKILVVEDDTDISELIGTILTENGYFVDFAYSGTEAMLLFEKNGYDLLILDLMLPGMSGEEIVKKIGEIVPIIIVSAKSELDDKVHNLLNGAVDFLSKPFYRDELLARVAVQFRKKTRVNDSKLRYESVYIDTELNTAFAGDIPLKLTKTEFGLLYTLLKNPRRIFSKAQLAESLSDSGHDVWESSLNVHICNLRKKLFDACGIIYIEAVWSLGYKFAVDKNLN